MPCSPKTTEANQARTFLSGVREIDFVIQHEDNAVPVEVKAGGDKKASSFNFQKRISRLKPSGNGVYFPAFTHERKNEG